jgi:hypothetical protein
MRFSSFLFMVFFPFLAAGQDLNGIWKGELTQEEGGCYPKYFIELQINSSGNSLRGTAYDYYDKTSFVKLYFTGRFNPQTGRLVLIENKVSQYRVPVDCIPCLKTYDLDYARKGAEETISGRWKGHFLDKQKTCPPGNIFLKRAAHTDFPVDIVQSDSLVSLQQSLHLKPRSRELVQTVIVDTPAIRIALYDDAEIDGDTVTVLVNDKLLLYRQMLTDRPLALELNAFPDTEYELQMYADNLGAIPPNTALMVITAGDRKIEVRLSSSEEKTAAVKLIYRKKEDPRNKR